MQDDYDITQVPTAALNAFAYTVSMHLKGGVVSLAMALPPLYETAIELNRRHGAASEQTEAQIWRALDTLSTCSLVLNDPAEYQTTMEIRALGLLLDRGTDRDWNRLMWDTEWTREHALAVLRDYAWMEHVQRSCAPAVIAPEPHAVAPF